MSTKIEWTDETWNPITGCTKISPGCKHCYAERMARRLAGRYGYPEAPRHFDVTLHPDRLEQPLHWKKPRRIFVCSMSDLFHEDVPFCFVDHVFHTVELARQHTFQILTKRPERTLDYMTSRSADFPLPNVWLGVSVEDAKHLWRVEDLLQIPAAVRFVSLEPMLSAIDIEQHLSRYPILPDTDPGYDGISWVVCGGESGSGARPMDPDWARDVYGQCRAAGVPFFGKQDSGLRPGMPLLLDGCEVKEWPILDTN